MLVAQRDIVHGSPLQGGLEGVEPDQRGPVLVRDQDVDGTVPDNDAGHPVGRQVVDHLGDQVGGRGLRVPGCRDQLQTWTHLVNAGAVKDDDVVGALGGEQCAGVDRRGIQRIVIAGKQVDRHPEPPHHLQRSPDFVGGELVVFEHIAGDDDELGVMLLGHRTQRGDRGAPRCGIAGLGIGAQEVSGHAELPVSGVQKAHVRLSFPRSSVNPLVRAQRV